MTKKVYVFWIFLLLIDWESLILHSLFADVAALTARIGIENLTK